MRTGSPASAKARERTSRSAGAVRQQAPAVQIVGRGQTVRQGADAGSLVLLPGMGVDQKTWRMTGPLGEI